MKKLISFLSLPTFVTVFALALNYMQPVSEHNFMAFLLFYFGAISASLIIVMTKFDCSG